MVTDILAFADALVGAPYRLHGEDPATGWDCLGCVRYVRRTAFGRDTPMGGAAYTKTDASDPERVEALITSHMEGWRDLGSPAPGAVILFERIGRRDHVGVMLDDRTFLHAEIGCETVTGDIRGKWGRRARGFYEYG